MVRPENPVHMPIPRLVIPGILAIVASGCLNSSTLISVKSDGSGTIEQTMLVNAAAGRMALGGLEAPGAQGPIVNDADLRRTAESMGGVRFVSAEPMTAGGFEGVRALYAFDDVNTVRISQGPPPGSGGPSAFSPAPAADSPVVFHQARGADSSVLTVRLDEAARQAPDTNGAPAHVGPGALTDPQMLGMMKMMLQGFALAIDLEVDGAIVRTNADYVQGSRVTLLNVDLDALFEDEAAIADLQARLGPGTTPAQVWPYLKGVTGIRINQPLLTIEYR